MCASPPTFEMSGSSVSFMSTGKSEVPTRLSALVLIILSVLMGLDRVGVGSVESAHGRLRAENEGGAAAAAIGSNSVVVVAAATEGTYVSPIL